MGMRFESKVVAVTTDGLHAIVRFRHFCDNFARNVFARALPSAVSPSVVPVSAFRTDIFRAAPRDPIARLWLWPGAPLAGLLALSSLLAADSAIAADPGVERESLPLRGWHFLLDAGEGAKLSSARRAAWRARARATVLVTSSCTSGSWTEEGLGGAH